MILVQYMMYSSRVEISHTSQKHGRKRLNILKHNGESPNIHILNPECSYASKVAFNIAEVHYQFVSPHAHKRNAADRAIMTFKNHLITGLCICDTRFTAKEWDWIIPQAQITLIFMRSPRRNPLLLAYASLNGKSDFNGTPSPPDEKVLLHTKSENRETWSARGVDAWHICPNLENYRYFKCYIPKTSEIWNADTVKFFLQQILFSTVIPATYLQQLAVDIIDILRYKSHNILALIYGNKTNKAFIEIEKYLKQVIPPSFSKENSTPSTNNTQETSVQATNTMIKVATEPMVVSDTIFSPAKPPIIKTKSQTHKKIERSNH